MGKHLMTKVNILDKVRIEYRGSHFEGDVMGINTKGIEIRQPWGVRFYKWVHVKEIIKEVKQ